MELEFVLKRRSSKAAILTLTLASSLLGMQVNANAMGHSDLQATDSSVYHEMSNQELHDKITQRESVPSDKPLKKVIQATTGVPTLSITDKTRPRTDAVDVSSNNGTPSVNDFKVMKKNGVKTIVVKLTEFTTYKNPVAKQQIANAKAAGLNVSVYHYSWISSPATAKSEAKYFIAYAKSLGIPKGTPLILDQEEGFTLTGNITQNIQAFQNEVKSAGYVCPVYTYVSYVNQAGSKMNVNTLGPKSFWMAQYPFNPLKTNLWNTQYGAWQFSDAMTFPSVSGKFDASIDYTGVLAPKEAEPEKPTPPTKPDSGSSSSSSSKSSSSSSSKSSSAISSSKTSSSSSSKSSSTQSSSSSSSVSSSAKSGSSTSSSVFESSKSSSHTESSTERSSSEKEDSKSSSSELGSSTPVESSSSDANGSKESSSHGVTPNVSESGSDKSDGHNRSEEEAQESSNTNRNDTKVSEVETVEDPKAIDGYDMSNSGQSTDVSSKDNTDNGTPINESAVNKSSSSESKNPLIKAIQKTLPNTDVDSGTWLTALGLFIIMICTVALSHKKDKSN
ncbi:GH25 family lysozyme M1 (1,4-beta-N-acetylmuramidase) [Weissella uvarum]|uniref:GH25 family lysozyme n=1 Tax=Weissella uvarum TaxID=1479233 RepID=UPI0019619FC7|nr:GH25 family lysozyme [Weissella uvarum]MBM7617914.1 GH25 family lysozyme M1 (1,4-beta-N-acetylmuramidase) [Weissella uvarum]MCM0596089.1 DUF1906 domain-containing protein [Weissella uvarum]